MDAIIGHTGFVGGNLATQHRFGACYNSQNIESIRGKRFDMLVVSGMPAAKWLANRDSAGDRAVLDRLWGNLNQCEANSVVLISTVDVYPAPVGVDEDTLLEPLYQQSYGRHRWELERRIALRFSRTLTLRLPGLFGPGLKKNAIYDLIHENQVNRIHPDGAYQFYNLSRLWSDLTTAFAANLTLVNLVTEPVTMREVARAAFGFAFGESPDTTPPRYDVRTKHASVFGGSNGYLQMKEQVLAGIAAYVKNERLAERMAA